MGVTARSESDEAVPYFSMRRRKVRLLRRRKYDLAVTPSPVIARGEAPKQSGFETASPNEQTRLAVTPERRDCFGDDTTTSQ